MFSIRTLPRPLIINEIQTGRNARQLCMRGKHCEGHTLCVNCTITGAQDGVAVCVDIPQTLHQCLGSLRGRGRQQLEQHTPASECPATLHHNIVHVNTHACTFTCTVHISCCTALLQICEATYIDTKQTHTTEKQSYSYHMWWRDCNSREAWY